MLPRHRSRAHRLFLLSVVVCVSACVEPLDRRPGTWLSGEIVTEAVGDWTFSDAHREILIETRTRYWIPHSVTIVCAARDGKLYVGARNPDGKRWVANVDRDPEVLLKIGDRVYEQRLVPVDAADVREAVFSAYSANYGWPASAPEERPPFRTFEVVEREAG